MKKNALEIFRSYTIITVASLVYALAFNCFYAPNNIAYGGATGIAQMINRLFGTPTVGVLIILLNIPLFIIAFRVFGAKLILASVYAIVVSSALIDIIGGIYTFAPLHEPIMASIFGGVTLGTAAGLIFREGASLGGSDMLTRLLRLKMPGLSVGQVMMSIDLVVIAGVSLVFAQLNSALYGIVALYLSSKMMDRMLYGVDPAKVAYIISSKTEEISSKIIKQHHRGITILHGEGAWSGDEKRVLMCAFKNRQIVALKKIVKEADPDAFLIVCEAYEVLGDGFLKYDPKKQ
ncbi:MAG: YitT family protein [Evtepia sp.]